MDHLNAIQFRSKGAQLYIPLDELALKLTVLCLHKHVGNACSITDAAHNALLFVQAEGEAMPAGLNLNFLPHLLPLLFAVYSLCSC